MCCLRMGRDDQFGRIWVISKRGKTLDISWLRDESVQSGDDLPEPEVIAGEIWERLRLVMTEMEKLTELLVSKNGAKDEVMADK